MEPKSNYCLTFKYCGQFSPLPHCLDLFCLPRLNVHGNNLFPLEEYPVPVGTPLISPYIKWDHSQDWDVPKAEDFPSGSKGSASASIYNIGAFAYLGFSVCLFPALPLHFFSTTRKRMLKAAFLKVSSEASCLDWKRPDSASEMGRRSMIQACSSVKSFMLPGSIVGEATIPHLDFEGRRSLYHLILFIFLLFLMWQMWVLALLTTTWLVTALMAESCTQQLGT